MKRAFLLVWVIVASMGQLLAKDQQDLAYRQQECLRMAKEFNNHAKELDEKAKRLEGDAAKAATELSALKKEEAENCVELAEAIDKKLWNTIKRLDKKGEKLCEEWSEKMAKFEKKFGDKSGKLAHEQEKDKEGKPAFGEKSESVAGKPEWKKEPKPEWKKEPKPEPVMEAKSEEPPPGNPSQDKINAQAMGLGNP